MKKTPKKLADASTKVAPTYPTFKSVKAPLPIPYRYRWHHQALVQLSLDPTVDAIACLDGPAGTEMEHLTLVVLLAGKWTVFSTARDCLVPQGYEFRRLVRDEVLEAPANKGAQAIWSHRKEPVSLEARMTAMDFLHENGGSSIEEFVRSVETVMEGDALSILRLICEGVVEIDMVTAIVPDTMVRLAGSNMKADAPPVRRSLPRRSTVRARSHARPDPRDAGRKVRATVRSATADAERDPRIFTAR